ncbi:MAG: NADH-quinone oxidoreductase subunit M [Thaumarchaeota archaeon]|nr:NADH-quinone oxidoreductase subunit M [Nitrososphaerota archaeon]
MSVLLSLLIVLPLLGTPLVFLAARWNKRVGINLALSLAGVIFLLAIFSYWVVFASPPAPGQYSLVEKYPWVSFIGLNYLLGLDGLSAPLVLISSLLTIFVMIGSKRMMHHMEPEYYALLLFFEGSIMGVFLSLNLILFYIFWELVLIPMFFFIGFWGGPRKKYAAMKFILFTYAGSTVMLLGFLAVYLGAPSPSFDIPDLAGKIPLAVQYLPLLATFIGFGVKLPVVPFHTWLPDAHVEAPAPISVLLAGVLLKMGGYGFLRISLGLFPQASSQYAWAFLIVAAVTMFYGSIVALVAKDLKRMIALTSINHMGFVLFGAFATAATGNILGVQGAILQMFTHAFAVGALFMLSGYIHEQAGTREIPLLHGLKITMPRTALLLVLASAAAMAVPPFASFLAEFFTLAAGISAFPLTGVVVLVPVITSGYFLWMIKRVVLSPPSSEPSAGGTGHDIPKLDAATIALYFVPLLLLLVFSSLILGPSAPVAQFLAHLGGR